MRQVRAGVGTGVAGVAAPQLGCSYGHSYAAMAARLLLSSKRLYIVDMMYIQLAHFAWVLTLSKCFLHRQ